MVIAIGMDLIVLIRLVQIS